MTRYIQIILIFLLVMSIATPAITAGENLTDPYKIYGKYLDYLGGLEKLKAQKQLYSEGTFDVMGMKGTIKQWQELPDKSRVEIDLKVFKQTVGENGTLRWTMDTNGKVVENKDEITLKDRKLQKRLKLYEHVDPKSKHFKIALAGTAKVGTADCYVIKITNTINKDIQTEYINKANFRLEKTIRKQPETETITVYADYRDVGDGTLAPLQLEMEILPMNQKQVVKITKTEAGLKIPDTLFQPPQKKLEDYSFMNGKKVVELPFSFIDNHIYLTVVINGDARIWCLDSGAGATCITPAYSDELGLKSEGSLKARTAGGEADASFVMLPPFRVKGIEFKTQRVVVLDFSIFFDKIGLEVVGILGYDFLSRFVTRIDYAEQKLTIYESSTFEYKGKGSVLDAPLAGNLFIAPMTVEGIHSKKWRVDIGAGGTTFHYQYAKEQGYLERKGRDIMGGGAAGNFKMRQLPFKNLKLGDFTITSPYITIPAQDGGGAMSEREYAGNLGNSVFRHFVIYLDYERQKLIVEKGKNFNKTFPVDRSGLQVWYNKKKQMAVSFAAPGTAAAKAGFKTGDILLAVNAIPVENLDGVLALMELFTKEAGTTYKITIQRNNKKKELKLVLKN
ncbi:MAG: PDZ domain-containing protein [bacterium]|nr:PDZ domain-containing protein [bacterium]